MEKLKIVVKSNFTDHGMTRHTGYADVIVVALKRANHQFLNKRERGITLNILMKYSQTCV